jgi:hypothetical protein
MSIPLEFYSWIDVCRFRTFNSITYFLAPFIIIIIIIIIITGCVFILDLIKFPTIWDVFWWQFAQK